MRQKICVMLTTQEQRKFFASKKDLKVIQEFAKRFNMQMTFVKTNTQNIQSLETIAKLICNQTYTGQDIAYLKIESKDEPKKICDKTQKIRDTIENIFLKHHKTSLKDIKSALIKNNISVSSLSSHFSVVRRQLSIKGLDIQMIKKGTYIIK